MAQKSKNIHQKARLLMPLLLILAFLMQSCGIDLLGSAQPTAALPYPTPAPTPALPEAMIEFHVDGIISDYPDQVLKLLNVR